MSEQQGRQQWRSLLAAFSRRHRARRVWLDRQEAPAAVLENISVELSGADAPRVLITCVDESAAEPEILVTIIPHVQRISGGDEGAESLEIEDQDRDLTVLSLAAPTFNQVEENNGTNSANERTNTAKREGRKAKAGRRRRR